MLYLGLHGWVAVSQLGNQRHDEIDLAKGQEAGDVWLRQLHHLKVLIHNLAE